MLLNRKIFLKGIVAVIFCCGMASCSDDDLKGQNGSSTQLHDQIPLVTINISPLTRAASADGAPSERIKDMRIIMLNNDEIEFNRYVSFVSANSTTDNGVDPVPTPDPDPSVQPGEGGNSESGDGSESEPAPVNKPYGELASDMATNGYKYVFPSKIGKKSFFIIGNEQSVKNVRFQFPEGVEVPQRVANAIEEKGENLSLTEVLNLYSGDYIGNHTDAPGEFASVMNALFFEPEYTVDDQNNIYLPYSCFYDNIQITAENTTPGQVNIQNKGNLYLVPCATKFTFHFNNYRKNAVNINSITLSGIAAYSYLNAQVEKADSIKKSFTNKKDLYWIDWLKEVSDLSENNPDYASNVIFNSDNGWISHYKVPASSYPENNIDGNKTLTIPRGKVKRVDKYNEEKNQPSTIDFGPFYLPESFKTELEDIVDSDGNLTGKQREVQKYHLFIEFQDDLEGAEIYRPDLVIGNLNAMFRNTNVIINITMKDWDDVGAYAEIQAWTEKTVNGYIKEDN